MSTGQGQEHMEQTRLLFEAGVAWQAARVATDEDIRRLKAALDANAAAIGNTGLFVRTDVAFHSELTVITRNPVFTGVYDALVGWLIDQRTTTIHMPDADRLSIRDHTAIYEAVAARDPMRAFHEMTSHLRLISELYRESKRLSDEILRQVARDVAGRIERERESMWVAEPRGGDEQGKPVESCDGQEQSGPEDEGQSKLRGKASHDHSCSRRGCGRHGHGLVSQEIRSRRGAARSPARRGHGNQLGKWRRHPCQRGRALVPARHADEDHQMAGPRRMPRSFCATAPYPHILRWGIEFARNSTPERFRENSKANLHLALHSLKSLQEIGAETGIAYDRATRGVLKIYRSGQSLDGAERSMAFLARHGLLYERVDPDRCVELEPALTSTKSTLAGALYFARDEVGDSNKFTQGARRGLRGARRAVPVRRDGAEDRDEQRPRAGRHHRQGTDRGRYRRGRHGQLHGAAAGQERHPRADLSGEGHLDHLQPRRLEYRAATCR